ncbi:MAG: CHAT domain-containing protein [Bacteroidales bacterium]|nr:CHAT domain-containing protein [Bacteroidales bacterium]
MMTMIKQLISFLILFLPLCVCGQKNEANKLFNQGVQLFEEEKINEALLCFKKCDSLDKATLKPTSKKYHRTDTCIYSCYSNILERLSNQGNDAEALRLSQTIVEFAKSVFSEDHPLYLDALNNLSLCYFGVGDYQNAVKVETECGELVKKYLGEESEEYCSILNNLSAYNSNMDNNFESIRLSTIAMNILKKISGEDSPNYALSVYNLACFYGYVGNYEERVRLHNIAFPIFKKTLGEEHPYYAMSLNGLADSYDREGNYTDAVKYGKEAMEIVRKYYGESHWHYFSCATNLVDIYLHAGEYDKATQLLQHLYNCIYSYILKNFACMTSSERFNYWKEYEHFLSYGVSSRAALYPNPMFNRLSYDAQLFVKGLLLNTELELQKLIEKSGDTALINRYLKIQQNRMLLDNLTQQTIAEREIDADSLQANLEQEELSLIQSSKALGDYTHNLSISWLDVQKKLNDNDLAIEFSHVEKQYGEYEYVAHILKKGMTSPEIVSLFGEDSLYMFSVNEIYNTPKLYNALWKPLEKYLQGVKNVYFSPCAKLHTIGIEYMPDEKGQYFCEKYAAYRLSSTRELAVSHAINPNRKAATYGGILYNSDADTTNERGGIASYLSGTKAESDSVASLLRSANYSVVAYNDTAATEASFKHLSGSGLSILHIGTHGFYFSEDEMQDIGLNLLIDSDQTAEDRSLSCSGLLLAGANAAFIPELRQSIPESVGDGILTAKEISRLDFKGLDLVVLSACQSGLGKVNGEGVFGLQRGFKKAGAHTLVMSLWNVSDEATQLLMTEFFKNLTSGMTKREAFVAAQKVVRKKFPHPGLWAAFVMIDGI